MQFNVAHEVVEAVQQLVADKNGKFAAETLNKLLSNILVEPDEPKYRKVRLNNPKIQSTIVEVSGAVEFLLACQFQIAFQAKADESEEAYAVLDGDADISILKDALNCLHSNFPGLAMPSPKKQTLAPPMVVRTGPINRETQVILPNSVENEVPEWFWQRTGAELAQAFRDAIRRRERDSQLMTKAMRDKLNLGKSEGITPPAKYATIRVRLPEGLFLQGQFDTTEPAAAVFAWVSDCLIDPLQTFDLILGTTRKPVQMSAHSIRAADLVPTATLHLRWTGLSEKEMAGRPALKQQLLKSTE